MKKKRYLFASIVLLAISLAAFIYCLQGIGVFSKDAILVRALSCNECAQFEVVAGNSKIASQLQAPSDSVNIYQVYMTGEGNPTSNDYTKTYDYYLVTGKLTGLQKSKNSGMIFPVITAYTWTHISPASLWISLLVGVLFLLIAIRYFVRFRVANRLDATIVVLKTHSDPPLKKM